MESMYGDSKWKSLHQKLKDVYGEAVQKQPAYSNVKTTSNLIAQLVSKEGLNTLIINLFPGNEGYSIMLRVLNGVETETVRLPYEETELLDYIDAEKLPPLLVDLLDRAQANLFQSGCVIAEVRDYRRSINNTFCTQYVLLQPTMHTLLCDINSMTSEAPNWTVEDKLSLESQLLLHTSEPLCLDPSPVVFLVSARLNYEKHKLNSAAIRRCAKRCSQVSLNRRRKMAMCTAPKHLKLSDFVAHRKNKIKHVPPVNLKLGLKPCLDPWKKTDVLLTTPETIEVQKYAKALDRPKLTGDNSPIVVEEYMFETERSQGRVNIARLVIMQRLSDECFLGSLYVDRDFKDEDLKGSTCRFWLGTKANVEKYVRQFREIFTEEGRRQVKITHSVPGRQATVTYTQVLGGAVLPPSATTGSTTVSVAQQVAASGLLVADVQQSRVSIGQTMTISSTASLVSSTVAPSTAGGQQVAQLRLSLQQQQQLMRRKSNAGLPMSSSYVSVSMSGTTQPQASSGYIAATNSSVVGSSGSMSTAFQQDSSMTNRNLWAGQSTTGSLQLASLSSVVPPNVNIGNISALASNVTRLHTSSVAQSGSVTPRTFIAMVTSPSVFNSVPPQAVSTTDSPFSISIGGAGQQFVTAGGVVGGVRGVVNEQLALSRSMQGLSPRTALMLQKSPGSIHIQTDMSSGVQQMMSPPAMSPFHSISPGQAQMVHHQQITSPSSSAPQQTLTSFHLQGQSRTVLPSSVMPQLPSSVGGSGHIVNRNGRRPPNAKLP